MTALEVFKETVDLVLAFQRDGTVVDGCGLEQGVGTVGRLALLNAGAQAIKSRCGLTLPHTLWKRIRAKRRREVQNQRYHHLPRSTVDHQRVELVL